MTLQSYFHQSYQSLKVEHLMLIEHTIRHLESLRTCQQLETYLAETGGIKPYRWCCLLIQNTELQCLGYVPDTLSSKVNTLDLRRLNHEQFKPLWAIHDNNFPAHSIYIPQKALGTDCAAILLGLEPNLAPEFIEKLGWYWQIIATYVYDVYRRCQPSLTEQFKLTKREFECLHWVVQGKTSWEIGHILGISERTVNFHIGNCMDKSGCVNRRQLVVRFMNIL